MRGIHWSPVDSPTKASDAELWCFLWSAPEQKAKQTVENWAGDLRRHRAHYDVAVEENAWLNWVLLLVLQSYESNGIRFAPLGNKLGICSWEILIAAAAPQAATSALIAVNSWQHFPAVSSQPQRLKHISNYRYTFHRQNLSLCLIQLLLVIASRNYSPAVKWPIVTDPTCWTRFYLVKGVIKFSCFSAIKCRSHLGGGLAGWKGTKSAFDDCFETAHRPGYSHQPHQICFVFIK